LDFGQSERHGLDEQYQLLQDRLVRPKDGPFGGPIYKDGNQDALDSIEENGCVDIPEGLGVASDCDFITASQIGSQVIE